MRRNVSLGADLETAVAEGNRLKDEMETQEKLAADLVATLEKQRVVSESALKKQKAEAEKNLQAEAEAAYREGAQEVTMHYEAQVLNISQEVWELGWRAAMKEAGVSEDHPAYKNPSKFPTRILDRPLPPVRPPKPMLLRLRMMPTPEPCSLKLMLCSQSLMPTPKPLLEKFIVFMIYDFFS